jgi:hypothetical protein
MSSFATFWAGNGISPYELACLKSFGLHGYEVALFTYNELSDLPEGVHRQDAREILGREYMDSFILNERPSAGAQLDRFSLLGCFVQRTRLNNHLVRIRFIRFVITISGKCSCLSMLMNASPFAREPTLSTFGTILSAGLGCGSRSHPR